MKKCPKCGKLKNTDAFSIKSNKRDGLQPQCRVCASEYQKDWYKRNKIKRCQQIHNRTKRVRDDARVKLIAYLKLSPCVDCGEKDSVVLQFDHVRGEKKYHISKMISWGMPWSDILEEIKKCQVRCANCHLKMTAKRANYYKLQKKFSITR